MNRRSVTLALGAAILATLTLPSLGRADDDTSGVPKTSELPFVQAMSADLEARVPTAADAEKAGYLRYTDEDDTGAVSYANRVWTSVDQKHPSQLWYDVRGRLLGADFSVPYTDAPPHLFGVDPSRWSRFGRHEHYGLVGPKGETIFGATSAKKLAAVGGDPAKPTAENLVALGIAKSPADVRFVFEFPTIWDLSVWVTTNPRGAFADKNPLVTPVNPPKPGMDM
jgi:hypothetical protein